MSCVERDRLFRTDEIWCVFYLENIAFSAGRGLIRVVLLTHRKRSVIFHLPIIAEDSLTNDVLNGCRIRTPMRLNLIGRTAVGAAHSKAGIVNLRFRGKTGIGD